jgi:hypothetical protein
MSRGPYKVSARLFRDWWERLIGLDAEEPDDDGRGNLLEFLYHLGRRVGATEVYLVEGERTPGSRFDTVCFRRRLSATFDWDNGEIDMAGMLVDPEVLIAALVGETGISE